MLGRHGCELQLSPARQPRPFRGLIRGSPQGLAAPLTPPWRGRPWYVHRLLPRTQASVPPPRASPVLPRAFRPREPQCTVSIRLKQAAEAAQMAHPRRARCASVNENISVVRVCAKPEYLRQFPALCAAPPVTGSEPSQISLQPSQGAVLSWRGRPVLTARPAASPVHVLAALSSRFQLQ